MRENPSLRIALSIGTLVFLVFPLESGLPAQEQNTSRDSLDKAIRTYFEYPSTDNALRFCQSLPEQPVQGGPHVELGGKIVNYIFDNISVLIRQISVGDRNAAKLGFRLFRFSDGAFAEMLPCIMGDLVRTHPKLFLEELKAAKNAHWIEENEYPVTRSMINFEDRWPGAHKYELEMRTKALESVKDEELADLRETCIREIREYLAWYNKDSHQIILDEGEYLALFKKAVIDVYNQAETCNLVCSRKGELEDFSSVSTFGTKSEKLIRSSGIYDELVAAEKNKWGWMEKLRNPPFSFKEAYACLEKMGLSANQLHFQAIMLQKHPESFKKAVTSWYSSFKNAYANLVTLMPEIDQDVHKNMVDLESIKKRLR